MVRQVFRYALTLFGLQAVFGGIAFLLLDYWWLSAAVSLVFVWLLFVTGRAFAAEAARLSPWLHALAALLISAVSQLPGLAGTYNWLREEFFHTTPYDAVSDLLDFGMETWHTVLLPLITAVPKGLVAGDFYLSVSWYYVTLVATSPMLILLFTLAATVRRPARRTERSLVRNLLIRAK